MNTNKNIDRKSSLEWKKKYTIAIKQNVEKSNWGKIEEILPAAKDFGVAPRLLQQTWYELGQHLREHDKLVSALESFSSARIYAIDNNQIYNEIIQCLSGFINRFETKLSREDLVHLEYAFNRIFRFHTTRKAFSSENQTQSEALLKRIRELKNIAPSKRETPATTNVFRIFAALYPGMTEDEVKVEFARIVAPLIRKKLSEKASEAKKPSSAGAGKKPPKDNDDQKDSDEKLDEKKSKKGNGKSKPKKK